MRKKRNVDTTPIKPEEYDEFIKIAFYNAKLAMDEMTTLLLVADSEYATFDDKRLQVIFAAIDQFEGLLQSIYLNSHS